MGNVSGKKKQKTRAEKKEGKKKALIHSHRCVTPLLPQQKFTTELMTKGRAPMQPIVACRTMWRLWKANPSAPLTGWAFKQTRGAISPQGWVASDSGGKPRATHHHWAFAQSADWDTIVRGEYYLHCQAVVVFVVSEDEPGGCPTEERPGRWRSLCECCLAWFCLFDCFGGVFFFINKMNHFGFFVVIFLSFFFFKRLKNILIQKKILNIFWINLIFRK